MDLAPVVLIVYNRLDYTKQTIEALKKNILSKSTSLYIYSDAAKDSKNQERVTEVRNYLYTISGFKEIHVIERNQNYGLTQNVISSVTEIVNQCGKVIVLEDDIVVADNFLEYMNESLTLYENEERVKAISAFWWPGDRENLPETFFLPWFTMWGWATWKRSWKLFERNPQKTLRDFPRNEIPKLNFYGGFDLWKQVEENAAGTLDSWAIFFITKIWENKGLVLHFKFDLCKNIGLDGSGEHCKSSFNDKFIRDKLAQWHITNFTERIEIDNEALQHAVDWFKKHEQLSIKRATKFIDFCTKSEHIYCYGPGEMGGWLAGLLARNGYDIEGFIETRNPIRKEYYGRPIYPVSYISSLGNVRIVIAANFINRQSMLRELQRINFENYFPLDEEIKALLDKEMVTIK